MKIYGCVNKITNQKKNNFVYTFLRYLYNFNTLQSISNLKCIAVTPGSCDK